MSVHYMTCLTGDMPVQYMPCLTGNMSVYNRFRPDCEHCSFTLCEKKYEN